MLSATIVFLAFCVSSRVASAVCPSGWFGSNCLFQCHCTSNCTTSTTDCPSNYKCDKKWFGSACQYKDLANLTFTTINCNPNQNDCTWLTDRNDDTCNPGANLQSVVITLNASYPYTWLRLAVDDNASFDSLQVSFKTDTSTDIVCTNQLMTFLDGKRADIRCNTMFDVKQVIIEGQGLRSLCSVYINGGRNVALKQPAVQNSNYTSGGQAIGPAENAVDGNTANIFNQGSCTHTQVGDKQPNWNLTFSKPQIINSFFLYNRNDCCQDRLKQFTLQTFDSVDKGVYQYNDSNNQAQVIYTVNVQNTSRNIPVSKINIRATSDALTLCEVEAFGDCSPGSWGLDCVPCDNKCNTCHPETGACLYCNGYNYPPNCNQTCPAGLYGINCAKRCSTNCSQNLCDVETGYCKACQNGYRGNFCEVCPSGWFGSNCTFQCHCTSNCTTSTTECPSTFRCEREWFGSACQYKDLANLTTTTVDCNATQNGCTWLIDRNDDTCNTDANLKSVVITLNVSYPYTWLRLAINDNASLDSLQVTFKTDTSTDIVCTNQLMTFLDGKRADIRCDTMFDVKQVIIGGQGLRSLCSVYISGGRNVALKQHANQSSTYTSDGPYLGLASNAVDGITANIFSQGSCTHTIEGDKPPNLNVTFSKPQVINRFVLYNRNDCCQYRLMQFSLQTFDADDKRLYQYNDSNNQAQGIYTVTVPNTARNVSVSKINIRANATVLTLCEVEAFGECSPDSWGLDCVPCDGKCNTCHPETGACLVCNGYNYPPNCNQTCQPGTYEINCAQRCSTNCSQGLCDVQTGHCISCPDGYEGNFCDKVCQPGHWGRRCNVSCNVSCWDSLCNNVNGTCDYGCDGFSDVPDCTEVCVLGKWGKNCSQDCSNSCYNQSCNRLNGTCDEGCLGYSNPPSCNITCPFGKWGKDCQHPCSSNCFNTSCHRLTGICDQGCRGYSNPPDCNKVCDPTTWGNNCTSHCKSSCYNSSCDHKNGSCNLGCGGYNNPPDCTEACPVGYWGQNCTISCSPHCSNSSCDGQAGKCYQGCKAGYSMPYCIEAISASPETPVGAIVGAIIAVIVICVLIVIGVMFWRKRQSKMDKGVENKQPDRSSQFGSMEFSALDNKQIDSNDKENSPTFSTSDGVYNNVAAYKIKDSQPIAVKDLGTFIHAHKMDYFEDQFKKIPAPKDVTTEIGMNSLNKHKNRYKNICPYDHSRVHLEINTTKNEEDYINASYVEGFNKDDKFIASQGPNKIILNDFIRMMWEQSVDKVVMLTNLIEEGTVKCEKYWPNEGSLQFGEIQVKMISTETFADYVIRVLELSKPTEAARTFTQFHFTSWPDKGVPVVPWALVDFEQRVFSQPTSRPIVVHCSAGVGRTGTFIALHNVMREAEQTGHVDFLKTVVKLRQDRMLMIQTAEQYWFLHKAAQVAILCIGTTVTSGNIVGRIKHLEEISLTGKTKMEAEFKAVSTVCEDSIQDLNNRANDSPETDGSVYQNSDEIVDKLKNRFSNIIPNPKYRPFLACETKDMRDYINAVFLPGFKKKDQQLLTQLPMPKTVVDFWRLVTQYNISLIVAFDVDAMLTDETFGHYLPQGADQGLTCSPYLITLKDIKKSTLWEEHKLMVATEMRKSLLSPSPNNNESQEVIHLKCLLTNLDPDKLLSILRQIRSYNALTNGRIVYTCSNGAKYSGLACVLSLLLDRMEHDSCLTVPLVVGMIKTIRPEVIPNLDQYRVLYDVLGRYSDNTVTYGNLGNVAQNGALVSKENANLSFDKDQDTNIYANY